MNFTNNQIIAFYKNVNYTEKITFCFVDKEKKREKCSRLFSFCFQYAFN